MCVELQERPDKVELTAEGTSSSTPVESHAENATKVDAEPPEVPSRLVNLVPAPADNALVGGAASSLGVDSTQMDVVEGGSLCLSIDVSDLEEVNSAPPTIAPQSSGEVNPCRCAF